MTKIFFALTFFVPLYLFSFSKIPLADEAVVKSIQKAKALTGDLLTADTNTSRIRFVGRGVEKAHAGMFKLSSGTIGIVNNRITSGSFVINIKSMDLEDKGGIYDRKLYPHLMGEDFFEAEKYNTARFEITEVTVLNDSTRSSATEHANFLIGGNLTLKNVTHNISFPARVALTDSSLMATSNFTMNRKLWNMNYGSEKSLGDKFISEKVNIQLQLEAKRSMN